MRAAFDDATRDVLTGLTRVVALSGEVTRGLAGTQQGLATASGCRGTYQSEVHSQTLPVMSERPYPFGGKLPTGEVPS